MKRFIDRRHDRAYLLSEAKRDSVLDLSEVERYGEDCFGDRNYVSLYGLAPAEWYARGVRLLARTAVECTRDRLADLIGRDVAAVVADAPAGARPGVVDLFAGSCNTLFWIARHVSARQAVGFELDAGVFEATRANLELVGATLELRHQDFVVGLRDLAEDGSAGDGPLIAFVAPPWGDALDEAAGLNLRATHPPVAGVVDLILQTFPDRPLLVAVQLYERVEPRSLAELAERFDWSEPRTYDINEPGRNHGLLLGTRGWTVRAEGLSPGLRSST